ncbi:MAG: penicillin-binding protein activator [Pseudomonadales bacterium]|nr:penicillin-binding protein activator [Pseudomonadales bacterium]
MNMRFYLALACLLTISVPGWAQIPFYAILLPETGMQAGAAEHIRTGLIAAYYADTQAVPQRPGLQFYDTDAAPIDAVYQQAIHDGAQAVIGPLQKDQVTQLLHQQTTFPIPTLLLNRAEGPAAINGAWELSLSPEDEIPALIQAAHQAGLHNIAILDDPDPASQLHARHLADAWLASGGTIALTQTLHAHGHILEDLHNVLYQPAPPPAHRKRHHHTKIQPPVRRALDGLFLATGSASGAQIHPSLLHMKTTLPIYALSTAVSLGKGHADFYDLQDVIYSEIPWLAQPPDDLYHLLTTVDPMQGSARLRLVALGIDAWQLLRQLSVSPPAWPWKGRTGDLKPEGSLLIRQTTLNRVNDGGLEILP